MKKIYLLILCLCLQQIAAAQRNELYESELWATGNYQCFFRDTSFLTMELQGRSNTDTRFNSFSKYHYRQQAALGYHFHLGQSWWMGFSTRIADEKTETIYYQRFQVQHFGKIRSVNIIKKISGEWTDYRNNPFSQLTARFLLGINKDFRLANKNTISATLSGELFQFYDIGEIEIERRYIDKTRFRGELLYDAGNVSFGIFATLQTRYFFVLPTYKGGQIPPPGPPQYDKLNIFTPIFGITVYKRAGELNKVRRVLFRAME